MLFDAVLKLRSAAELERLIDVEILPSCDPRLSAAVPSTSVYFGINEAVKTAIENAAQMPAQTSSSQLQENSLKTAVPEDSKVAGDDSVPASRVDAAETRIHEKSRVKQSPQKTESDVSSSKQTTSSSRKHKASSRASDASHTVESVNEHPTVAPAPLRDKPRTGTDSTERGPKRSVTKVHSPRKRRRKVYEESARYDDSFPSMEYLMNDELEISHHLPQLSYFAELDKNPDDPMMLISLYEIDETTAFHRQNFMSDLNTSLIGRKLRYASVHSPYRDRTSSRLGQLTLQTYCDGHFIECGSVSQVHMLCLHQWAVREPLEKVVCNMSKDGQDMIVTLPYPSVSCMSDACSWLSGQLCYLMLDMGIECIDPPDIFIGSSLQSELTTNCLYRMFCRYVDFLCAKSDKYFQFEDIYKAIARAQKESARAAGIGDKHAKRLKQTSYSSSKKDPSRQMTKKSSRWQANAEYDYEDVPFEEYKPESLEGGDLEKMMPLREIAKFDDNHAEKAAGYSRRRDEASASRRKRKLPKDNYDDYDRDVQSKARRVHRERGRLSARDRENDSDDYRRRRDRRRSKRRDTDASRSARQRRTSPSAYEDSPHFLLYDEDGNIVVQCSDTGEAMRYDELQSSADTLPTSLSVIDEWYESNHQLYGVVHDHSYSAAPQCSPATPVHDKEHHLPAVGVKNTQDNSALPVAEADDAKSSADGRKSQLSSDRAVESNAKKIHPLSSLSVVSTTAVSEVNDKSTAKKIHPLSGVGTAAMNELNAKSTAKNIRPLSALSVVSTSAMPKENAEGLRKSPKQPVTNTSQHRKKLVRPPQMAEKEHVTDARKNREAYGAADSLSASASKEVRSSNKNKPETNDASKSSRNNTGKVSDEVGEKKKIHPLSALSVVSMPAVSKVNAEGLRKSPRQSVTKKPEERKKLVRPQETSEKEPVKDAQKNRRDVGENEYSKASKSKTDAVDIAQSVSRSKEVGSSSKNRPYSTSSSREISTDASKSSTKKNRVPVENREKESDKVAEVPAKITEQGKASVNINKISEAHTVLVDSDSKAADAEVSVVTDKTASDELPSAAALAAAARDASHYEDAYLSEMADAYGVWPSSNFDIAFDPTYVPEGHMYNPFRKTWPILQHVIDGKTDLLLKFCSFPDAKSFSIRRVMRENGFLWSVCLSLFEPAVIKPNSADSSLYSDLNAAGKMKSAKPTNSLMQAFRQAVEAKKKVAAKSKSAAVKPNSDDAPGTQVWSAKRPSGKVSIVFGSAVKSGGSLSSVVTADQGQPAKKEQTANVDELAKKEQTANIDDGAKKDQNANIDDSAKKEQTASVDDLLVSAISKTNSDIDSLISRKCGEQCLVKDGSTTESQSSVPVTSKHLSVMSDFTLDLYDLAEYKLVKMFAKDADEMESIEKSNQGNELPVVSKTSVITTCQPPISVSSAATAVISSSSTVVPSTTEITPVRELESASARIVSAAGQVSQPSISQSAASPAMGGNVSTFVSTTAVIPGSVSVSPAAAVSLTATVVASTVADMPPPPMPPLSLSRIGVGFESSRASVVVKSSSSQVSASWHSLPSAASASLTQLSTNPHSCTGAYQPTVCFAYPSPISAAPTPSVPAAFSSPSLSLKPPMLMPPIPQPNLYSIPPAVGMPLNVPVRPSGFVDTSVPPPPVPPCPPPPCPPTSAAGRFPTRGGTYAAVPVTGYKEIPKAAVSCTSASGNLQTSLTSVKTPPRTEQKNVTAVSYPSPLPLRPDVLNNQRPPTTVSPLSQASDSTVATAKLVPAFHPHPAFSRGLGQNSPAGSKSVPSVLLQGNRPLGPLKLVTAVTQSTPSRLSEPVVCQVRPVSITASSEIRPVSSLSASNVQLRGTVSGPRPTIRAPGVSVTSPSNHVPVRPAAASQSGQPSIGSSLVGQVPRGGVRPSASVSQLSQPTAPGSQPRAAGPLVGQSPRGAVQVRPTINQSAQPRVTVPASQPSSTIRPVCTSPSKPTSQPRTTGPLPVQSPHGSVQPRPPVNQPGQPRGVLPDIQSRSPVRLISAQPIRPDNQPSVTISSVVGPSPPTGFRPRITVPTTSGGQTRLLAPPVFSTSRGPPVCATSRLPSTPAQSAGTAGQRPTRPLTAVSGVQLGKGPLTSNSRVYVLNSDSSPVCKDVEVSL